MFQTTNQLFSCGSCFHVATVRTHQPLFIQKPRKTAAPKAWACFARKSWSETSCLTCNQPCRSLAWFTMLPWGCQAIKPSTSDSYDPPAEPMKKIQETPTRIRGPSARFPEDMTMPFNPVDTLGPIQLLTMALITMSSFLQFVRSALIIHLFTFQIFAGPCAFHGPRLKDCYPKLNTQCSHWSSLGPAHEGWLPDHDMVALWGNWKRLNNRPTILLVGSNYL